MSKESASKGNHMLGVSSGLTGRTLDREAVRRLLQGKCPPVDSQTDSQTESQTDSPAEHPVALRSTPAGLGGTTAGKPTEHAATCLTPGIPAAVLIGLLGHPEGPSIILTERTADLDNHPAQISLPGGRIEADDAGPAAAALREAFEEIGLRPEKVELLGCLPPHETVTGFRVYPFVGWIEPPVEYELDRREVAEVFEVPLSFVLDPANHHRGSIAHAGERRDFYVLPYPGHRIWGATAGILVDLARLVAP